MKALSELGISPAPWSADDWCEAEHGEYDVRIRDANDNEIAQPLSTFADARLIASAPDCYEALRMFIELCESYGCDKKCEDCICAEQPCIMKARAALAKAAGEEVVK